MKNKNLDAKNHFVVVFEQKRVKEKMCLRVKNYLRHMRMRYWVAFPTIFQDRSSVLIEPTQPLKLGTEKSP